MYEQKPSRLPFVQIVWRAKVVQEGEYDDPAKTTWGLAFTKRKDGTLRAELLGQSFHYKVLGSNTGDEYWGVEFYSYVTMRGVDKPSLTGKLLSLRVEKNHFFIGEDEYVIPTFDDIERFCEGLAGQGIISHITRPDKRRVAASLRSLQRSNLKLTGLTIKQQQQIKRATLASNLLKSGMKPAQVATEAGYTDQAHMIRSLKKLLGKTPAQIE